MKKEYNVKFECGNCCYETFCSSKDIKYKVEMSHKHRALIVNRILKCKQCECVQEDSDWEMLYDDFIGLASDEYEMHPVNLARRME